MTIHVSVKLIGYGILLRSHEWTGLRTKAESSFTTYMYNVEYKCRCYLLLLTKLCRNTQKHNQFHVCIVMSYSYDMVLKDDKTQLNIPVAKRSNASCSAEPNCCVCCLRASNFSVLKLIEIVILWVYYTIPFGFSLFWYFWA